jgi:hypothetical protein
MKETTYTAREVAVTAVITPLFLALMWIVCFPITMLYGWCDMIVWNWFGVPYFHLSPITLWTAIVLGSLISLTTTSWKMVKGEEPEFIKPMIAQFIGHALTLGTAYIIHLRWQP